jgi:hypothetical protein
MTHGFDLENPLVCEGVIGDGCGGGRIFSVQDETLIAYDPQTQSCITLLEDVTNVLKIEKSACIITVVCQNETIFFNLSTLSKV